MLNKLGYVTGTACLIGALIASSASAGGLSDAITESEPAMAPPAPAAAAATRGAVPGWVLPAVGLLVIGAIASGDSDGDGGTDGGTPVVIDPK